jgi:uncharacterized phiE125 gp8 family phage protein
MVTKHITYNVTVEPSSEPITLNEMKDRLRVTTCDFDNEINDLIVAGRQQVEHDTHRKLVTQTVEILLDDFPSGDTFEIRQLPVASVTSIAYTDGAGDAQTFASSNYSTDLVSKPPRIMLVSGANWPAVDEIPNAVTITVVCGTAVGSVPKAARLAIIEWCRLNWGDCIGSDCDEKKYDNLINSLAWSGYWKAL